MIKGVPRGTPFVFIFRKSDYNLLRESLIISSSEDDGFSLRTALTALFTFALVKPSITSAVTASSTELSEADAKRMLLSAPSPFTTLSLSSRISLCALLVPIPFMLFILLMSSATMAFLISSEVREESIMRAVDAPIPDTLIRRRNNSRSSLVANP